MNLRQSEEFGAMMGKQAGMFIASPEQLHDPFAKPSWFPWKTKSMIDKATEKEWDRMDKEEAWSDADQKILSDIGNDFTREGIKKRLNYYLDRRHGVVKNPYLSALDAADLADSDYDYEGVVEDSLPWRKGTKNDDLFDLTYEAQHPMYKDPANRQQLFDMYYPHLNLAKSVVKKKPLSKSASFGELMGKRASVLKNPAAANALLGAGLGAVVMGGASALGGTLFPGHTDKVIFKDNDPTRPILNPDGSMKREKRTRGAAALRGALLGAGAGGLLGGVLGNKLTTVVMNRRPLELTADYMSNKIRNNRDSTDLEYAKNLSYLMNRPDNAFIEDARGTSLGRFLVDNPATKFVRTVFER